MCKVAFVTGGSRGIGKAISEKFAKEGYNVIINFKENISRAEDVKKELETKYNIEVMLIKADLSDEKSIKDMVETIINKYKKIDVLVNNAGVVIDKEFDERTVEDWQETLKVNLIAPFLLTKLIGNKMFQEKNRNDN